MGIDICIRMRIVGLGIFKRWDLLWILGDCENIFNGTEIYFFSNDIRFRNEYQIMKLLGIFDI